MNLYCGEVLSETWYSRKTVEQTRVFLEIPCLLLECNVWSGLNQHSLAKIHIGSAFLYTPVLSLFFVGTYILLLSLVPSWMHTPTLSVSLPTPWNRFTHTHALPHSLSLYSSRLVSLFHFLQTDTHSLALSRSARSHEHAEVIDTSFCRKVCFRMCNIIFYNWKKWFGSL